MFISRVRELDPLLNLGKVPCETVNTYAAFFKSCTRIGLVLEHWECSVRPLTPTRHHDYLFYFVLLLRRETFTCLNPIPVFPLPDLCFLVYPLVCLVFAIRDIPF